MARRRGFLPLRTLVTGRSVYSKQASSTTTVDEGVVFEDETDTLIAQMDTDGTAPDSTRQGHINTLIKAMKDAGIWTKCDRIYVLAAHEEAGALIDWKTPGTDTLTNNSATAFEADRGFTGDGSADYLSGATNLSEMTLFTQNSAHISAWSRTSAGLNTQIIGSPTAGTHIRPRGITDVASARVNANASMTPAVADGSGFFLAVRNASNAEQLYRNGVEVGTSTNTSAARAADVLTILRQSTVYDTRQCAFASIGASLDATEADAFYDAVNDYMTAVGAV